MRYQVIDRMTGEVMGTYSTRSRARARRERLDLEYGAYRYFVKFIEVESVQ
jgi:hypothetical protein